MRVRSTHLGSIIPALLGVGSAGCSGQVPFVQLNPGTPPPTCAPLDYVVAPRAAGPLCVALPCSPLTAAPASIRADGDTIYYTDRTQILAVDANGQPQPLGAPPPVTVTESDGTTLSSQPEIAEFWVEPERFILVANGNVYAMARDGSALTLLGGPIPLGDTYAKDDAYVFEAMFSDGITGETAALYRVPLAGGPPARIATLSSLPMPSALYADATNLYVVERDDYRLLAFTQDGAAVTPPPVRPFADIIGFDGSAFFITREHYDSSSGYVQEIDRDLLSGESTTLWTDGALQLTAGGEGFGAMAPIPPGGQGGYVGGFRAPVKERTWGQAVVLKLDTVLHDQGCTLDPNVTLGALAVGTHDIYVVVNDDADGGSTWGIARLPR
jgi:hypothetical protein